MAVLSRQPQFSSSDVKFDIGGDFLTKPIRRVQAGEDRGKENHIHDILVQIL